MRLAGFPVWHSHIPFMGVGEGLGSAGSLPPLGKGRVPGGAGAGVSGSPGLPERRHHEIIIMDLRR